jgi:hypothetical protein
MDSELLVQRGFVGVEDPVIVLVEEDRAVRVGRRGQHPIQFTPPARRRNPEVVARLDRSDVELDAV